MFPDIPSDWILELILPLVRACFVGGMAFSLGSLVLDGCLLPPSEIQSVARQRLTGWVLVGLLFTLIMGLAWWPLISVEMTGAPSLSAAEPMMSVVLWHTFFGGELRLRFYLLVLALILCVLQRYISRALIAQFLSRMALALVLAGAILLQPMMGHGATVPALYLVLLSLHVLAACLWGGCLPGLFVICLKYPSLANIVLRRFSWVGMGCVVTIAFSGVVQSLYLVGSWHHLYTTAYGQFIVLKSLLFAVMLILASLNRFYWTPRVDQQPRGIFLTLGMEIVVGGTLLIVAALLSSEPPPYDMMH